MMVDAAGPNFNATEIEDILGFERGTSVLTTYWSESTRSS